MFSDLELTLDDIRDSDWQTIVDAIDSVRCGEYARPLIEAARALDGDEQRQTEREIYLLLGHLCSMVLRPEPIGVFHPLFVFEASRGAVITDFPDSYLTVLFEYLSEVRNPDVRARVGDVIWERLREYRAAQSAIDAYLEVALLILEQEGSPRIHALNRIERALQLGILLGRNSDYSQRVIDFIEQLLVPETALPKDIVYRSLFNMLTHYRIGDHVAYADRAAAIAEELESDQNWVEAREYWEISAQRQRSAGNEDAVREASIRGAEAYVSRAEMLANSGTDTAFTEAQFHVQRAIEAYRKIGHSQQRVQEIVQVLREYQSHAVDQLEVFSIEVDTTDLVSAAREHVRGHDFVSAILRLAHVAALPNLAELRDFVISLMQDSPFQYFVVARQISEDGRLLAERPAVDTDEERAILVEMFRHALMRYSLHATALIWPAAKELTREHSIREENIVPLLRDNPLVPEGRELIIAKGLVAGFHDEFAVAIHLLLPQIENSLRYLLSRNGVEISGYDDNGIQELMLLGEMLFRPELERLLGRETVFTFQCLLVERFGGNLRNQVAHGLMSSEGLYSAFSVYTWWLALHLYMRPLAKVLSTSESAEATETSEGPEAAE